MPRIDYKIAERETVFANLHAAGKVITLDNTTSLVDGVLQDCFCIVEDAPEVTE